MGYQRLTFPVSDFVHDPDSFRDERSDGAEGHGEISKITQVARLAIDTNGREAQINIAIGELAELIAVLTDHLKGRAHRFSVADEIADSEFCIEQLKHIFGREACDEVLDFKIDRLHKSLKEYVVGWRGHNV